MEHEIWSKKPSGWPGELWREALPLGNGKTSALLSGSVGTEHFWVNRYDRWEDGGDVFLPDASDTLPEARARIARGDFAGANGLLSETLKARGYAPRLAAPCAPVALALRFACETPYRRYRRGVNPDTGEAFVRYTQGEARAERRAFVSRADDVAALCVRADAPFSVKFDKPRDARLFFALRADGETRDEGAYIQVRGAKTLTLLASFHAPPPDCTYEQLFERHLPAHRQAMGDARLTLCDTNRETEALLDAAREDEAPPELFEKLWRFARYLFACGTAEGGAPFALYGLWNGGKRPMWSQNVANENVQMMYWHAPVGGFAHLLRPLIDYYCGKLQAFREAAAKLFGCRGIFVSAYTTPLNSLPAPNVPVIVNYTGCAGWLCAHFMEYYRYTGDDARMENKILPFMLETAAFYEDYAEMDARGRLSLCPSVSPENTPLNFMPKDPRDHMAHANPVVWNSTMDFAILKELLTNLLSLCEKFAIAPARAEKWRAMLAAMPPYRVNADGALAEWMDEALSDNYPHRHLSHLYPLFPGCEIQKGDPLFPACEQAVKLREPGGLSGWSMPHMAALHARLGRAEDAAACLDALTKSCLLNNLFTLHNDWRDMGATLEMDKPPVQLDALMGALNAVQEMLFRASGRALAFLPACPARLAKGGAENWRFPGGRASFAWNRKEAFFRAEIHAEARLDIWVSFPDFARLPALHLRLEPGQTRAFSARKPAGR